MTHSQLKLWSEELRHIKKLVVARAVTFEEKLQLNIKLNTRDSEDEVQRALDALGRITRRYMRLLKRKR